jgi:hypothetical protein
MLSRFDGAGKAAGRLAVLAVMVGLTWGLLDYVWQRFPYIRNGSRCVIDAKRDRMVRSPMYQQAPQGVARLMVCGNSHALCGFKPDLFDKLSGGKVYSYNLGLPGEKKFLPLLRSAIDAGNVPTHLFVMIEWDPREFKPSIWHWVKSDAAWADQLIPFRTLPRDFLSFWSSARKHGGLSAFYDFTKSTVDQMLAERGYHFIERSSLFPDHRLPDDFTTIFDDPKAVQVRNVLCRGPEFEEIQGLAEKHQFHVYLIPQIVRERLMAEPPTINADTVAAFEGHPRFHVLGPDYKRYSNRYFSDELHLNPEGAEIYTNNLWEISKQIF